MKPIGTVSFVTMGCAKNEVDSEDMSRKLRQNGYAVVDDLENANVIIVNTCSFIQAATEESIEAILDAANLSNVANGDTKLVVAGCMPARYGTDLETELPEVSEFVACSREDDIVRILDDLLGVTRLSGDQSIVSTVQRDDTIISSYVKISDGCDRFCAYCTIPYIRGRYHSFAIDDICSKIERAVGNGAKEIVLIAQDTGRWGTDFAEPASLAYLLDQLASKWSDVWFRVMYIQPEGITDELLDVVAKHENICSYLDIPFQHCNADILRSMNRKGDGQAYLALVEKIRQRIPDVTLRTTLIAGFPGETDEMFDELCEFVEEADLDYVGVFAYSREEGTRAYDLADQVEETEKE